MRSSPRVIRGGAFVLGMFVTLGVFFSFNQDWQGLTASVSDALNNDTPIVSADLIAHIDGDSLVLSTARTFPIHEGQSLRVDVLYNPLVFSSPKQQLSVLSPFLLSYTIDDGIISAILAPHDDETIASGTIIMTLHFSSVSDASDLPLLESVYRYDTNQSEALRVMYQ